MNFHSTLGQLGDPEALHQAINIEGVDPGFLRQARYDIALIRACEYHLRDGMMNKSITCPCHLCVGQEAIAVGISAHLRKTDRVFGAHRSHAHFLALNHDIHGLFAEVLGKVTGASKGMGGSMHLIDKENGFYGSVPIVGATIPIATGAGLAAKMEGGTDLAVSYFGDAACEEGPFHESLNLSANLGLPVLYVCENNLASSHMHISLRQPTDSMARFAKAHNIEHQVVDGNDIVAVSNAAKTAIDHIRSTRQPYFLEMVTYRWSGHVGPTEDSDVGVKRATTHVIWKNRDPLRRVTEAMINLGILTQMDVENDEAKIKASIDEAWTQALKDPYPETEALLDLVYNNKSKN
jgi:pyruvate dehydrogenase E1 component alpha subunit